MRQTTKNSTSGPSHRQETLAEGVDAVRFDPLRALGAAAASAALLGGMGTLFRTLEGKEDWTVVLFMAAIGAVAGLNLYRESIKERRNKIEEHDRQSSVKELEKTPEEEFFSKLIGITFEYIEQYYRQTREQADKSFRLCALVASVGFLMVMAGVALMYHGQTLPAYVTTASGVLTEFIGAVFFYLYNRTILKMSEYHKKLVLTQNVSLALKISDRLAEPEKGKALIQLMDRLSQDVNYFLVAENPNPPRATSKRESDLASKAALKDE